MWYCDELNKEYETLTRILKEVKREYEEAGVEADDADLIVEAIGRYLDLDSYDYQQVKQYLKGLGAILSECGVSEAFNFAVVFLFLSSNAFYLNGAATVLEEYGFVE